MERPTGREVIIYGGTGHVGTEIARQLLERSERGRGGLTLGSIVNRNGLYDIPESAAVRSGLIGSAYSGKAAFRADVLGNGRLAARPTEVETSLLQRLDDGAIVVDSTSLAEEVLGLYRGFAERGKENAGNLVTVNKSPLVVCGPEVFQTLAEMRKQFGFAGTVMAGTGGVVDEILTLKNTTDGVSGIESCLSGTLGYLCSAMEADTSDFSVILRRAKDNGYTEPDPRVDLSGKDVAKKLVILARAAGYDVNLSDVTVEPFVPERFLADDISADEFMRKLQRDSRVMNLEMRRMFDGAKRDRRKLRYVATMEANEGGEKPKLEVRLKLLEQDHALATLDGSRNRILIHTRDRETGHRSMIDGPGAGADITAQAVARDVWRMLGV